MHEFQRVFLDTAPVIYYVQQNEMYFEKVKNIFARMIDEKVIFVASDITTAEACVYPYRLGNMKWLNDFDGLVRDLCVEFIYTSEDIARKSAMIRAKYPSFKAMDSIQLATAVVGKCDLFLTNDKKLRLFEEIECRTINDFD